MLDDWATKAVEPRLNSKSSKNGLRVFILADCLCCKNDWGLTNALSGVGASRLGSWDRWGLRWSISSGS